MEQFINSVILDDVYSDKFAHAVSAIASKGETKPLVSRKMSHPD